MTGYEGGEKSKGQRVITPKQHRVNGKQRRWEIKQERKGRACFSGQQLETFKLCSVPAAALLSGHTCPSAA